MCVYIYIIFVCVFVCVCVCVYVCVCARWLAQAKILKFKIEKEDIEDVQKQLSDALDTNESMRGNLERSEAMQEELRLKLTRVQSAYAEIVMVSNQKTKNPLQRVASADSSDGAVRKGRRASFDPDGTINSPGRNTFSSFGDEFSRVASAPGRYSSSPRHFNSSSPPSTYLQSMPATTMSGSVTGFSLPSPSKRRGSVVAFSPSEMPSSIPASIEESRLLSNVEENRVLSNFSPVGRAQSFSVKQHQQSKAEAGTPRSVMRQRSAGQLSSIQQALPAASTPVAAAATSSDGASHSLVGTPRRTSSADRALGRSEHKVCAPVLLLMTFDTQT